MWEMMDGPGNGGVTPQDFSYILQIVRGSRFPDKEVYADPDEGQ